MKEEITQFGEISNQSIVFFQLTLLHMFKFQYVINSDFQDSPVNIRVYYIIVNYYQNISGMQFYKKAVQNVYAT